MEAVQQAGILANPSDHTADEMKAARRRFRELYVAELSMVESPWVETKMVELAKQIDPGLIPFTPAQKAAFDLSHALRDSFMAFWGVGDWWLYSLWLRLSRGTFRHRIGPTIPALPRGSR
jgi:hypothetical protein